MIDHLPFSLMLMAIGGSLRVSQPEETEKWKPSQAEVRKLREGMLKFEIKDVNGRKLYPYEQYCISENIISERDGVLMVKAPEAWRKMNDTHSYLQWEDEKNREQLFQAFPEERVAYEQRIETIGKEIRAMLKSVNKTKKVTK